LTWGGEDERQLLGEEAEPMPRLDVREEHELLARAIAIVLLATYLPVEDPPQGSRAGCSGLVDADGVRRCAP
jgi:hypothetical protein